MQRRRRAQPDLAADGAIPDGSGSILLVKPDTYLRKEITRLLRSRGYDVVIVDRPDSVTDSSLGGRELDLAIVAASSCGRRGVETLAKRVHSLPGSPSILWLTTVADAPTASAAAADRRSAVLRMPFNSDELGRNVRGLLAARNCRRIA